jgi:Tfp pilus assembly protein PilN
MDLKKEIKLSDLFKRGSKASEGSNGGDPAKPEKQKKVKPPKEPRRRKQPKAKRSEAVSAFAKDSLPVPDVPLMRAFNLLPREETRATATKEAQSPLPHILVALAGVLVFASLAAFYLMAGADVTKKNGQAEDLRAELAGYQAAKQQPLQDKSAALAQERISRTTTLGSALAGRLAWDRVLRELALVIPPGVNLVSIQASAPGAASVAAAPPVDGSVPTNFTLIGSTTTQASVAEFLARLSVIPELTSVGLKSAAKGTDPDNPKAVAFTITAALRGVQ